LESPSGKLEGLFFLHGIGNEKQNKQKYLRQRDNVHDYEHDGYAISIPCGVNPKRFQISKPFTV
jgi:hypothetical protein